MYSYFYVPILFGMLANPAPVPLIIHISLESSVPFLGGNFLHYCLNVAEILYTYVKQTYFVLKLFRLER